MKAVVLTKFGPAREALKFVADWPKPTRKPDEVLIEAHYSSINPIDWKTRKGMVPAFLVAKNKILGGDVSGVVLEAPEGSKFKPGDRVFGCTGQQIFNDPYGTYAGLVSAKESTLAHVPEGVGLDAAAGVPLAAMTAWQALAPSMPLAGKRVLVHGGSGGVGGFGIQIAKAQGAAHVATTCSARNAEYVTKELGADQAIDYTTVRFEDASGEPYDVVLDAIGGDYEERSLAVLSKKGHLAEVFTGLAAAQKGTLLGVPSMLLSIVKNSARSYLKLGPLYTMTVLQTVASKGLDQLADLMRQGKLTVHLDRVVPLEQTAEAHEYAEQSRTVGKLVLKHI